MSDDTLQEALQQARVFIAKEVQSWIDSGGKQTASEEAILETIDRALAAAPPPEPEAGEAEQVLAQPSCPFCGEQAERIVRAAVLWYERDSAAVAADDELLELAKATKALLDGAPAGPGEG